MTATLKLGLTVDGRQAQRDLRAVADGLDRPITDVLRDGAAEIADIARGFMRHGEPTWPSSSAARDFPGLISDYFDSKANGMSATVGSTHPAAPVWEWGGFIDPAAGGGIHTLQRELNARSASRRKIRRAGGRRGFAGQPLRTAGNPISPSRGRRRARSSCTSGSVRPIGRG
jgi:hypothetical protein